MTLAERVLFILESTLKEAYRVVGRSEPDVESVMLELSADYQGALWVLGQYELEPDPFDGMSIPVVTEAGLEIYDGLTGDSDEDSSYGFVTTMFQLFCTQALNALGDYWVAPDVTVYKRSPDTGIGL